LVEVKHDDQMNVVFVDCVGRCKGVMSLSTNLAKSFVLINYLFD